MSIEKLIDDVTRRSSYLSRYSTGVVRKVLGVVYEYEAQLAADLADVLGGLSQSEVTALLKGDYTTSRLKKLDDLLKEFTTKYGSLIEDTLGAEAKAIARFESDYTRGIVSRIVGDVAMEAPLSLEMIHSAATQGPVVGKLLKEELLGLDSSTRTSILSAIRSGFLSQDSVSGMVSTIRGTRDARYLDGLLNTSRRAAERMVRTAINHYATVAREETVKSLGYTHIIWVSVLDGRTSKICAARDGWIMPVDEGPRPPAHPNCRSTIIPQLDDMGGITRGWLRSDKPFGKIPKGERTGKFGQVSIEVDYKEWFSDQPAQFQRDWLGPTRYKLYKKGKLDIDRFVDDYGKELTLGEIKRKHRSIWREVFAE